MKKDNEFKNDNTASWVIIIIIVAVIWAIQHSVDIADSCVVHTSGECY